MKRLEPSSGSTACADERSFQWWRREGEVVASGLPRMFRGLTALSYRVEEDDEGLTLWSAEIELTPIPDELVARALARFGSVAVADPGGLTVDRLRDRVAIAAAGWDPSSSTWVAFGEFAPVIEQVWARRDAILDRLDALPHVLSHGDALPRNLLRHDGPDVVAIDWGQLGYAPIGADLASFSMWAGTDPARLLDAYTDEFNDRSQHADAKTGLVLTTALIAVSRAIRTIDTPNAAAYQTRLRRVLPLLVEATTIPT